VYNSVNLEPEEYPWLFKLRVYKPALEPELVRTVMTLEPPEPFFIAIVWLSV
jgi:hypothetical protein